MNKLLSSSLNTPSVGGWMVEPLEQRQLLAQTIAVDLGTPLQTIRAIGANVAKNARNPSQTAPVRDAASNYQLQNFDISMLRVAINIKTWEPVNDNADPNVVRAAGFPDFGGIKQNFEMMREYTQRGIQVVASVFDLPDWMVSNPEAVTKRELKPGYETELAESISHWLLYAKQQYGVKVDLISINEGNGGYNARFNQLIFTNFLKIAGPYMAARGLDYVKWLTGDDGVNTLNAHTKPLLENPEIRQYLGPVAYHSWSYGFINDANLEQWYVQAQRYGKEVWVTEFGTDAYVGNLGTFATFERAHETALAYYRALAVTRANVILWWQFASDFSLVNPNTFEPNPSYYIVKPFHDNVKAGAQMVKVSPANTGAIKTLATKDAANNKFFMQVFNGASAGTNGESVTLTGLPNTPLTIVRNTDGDYGNVLGTFTPVNGRLTFQTPAFSVINISGRLSNTGAGSAPVATINSPTGSVQYTSGGTINFSGTGTDAEDGTLAASRFNWTITPVRNGIVGDAVTIAGVKSGSYNIPAAYQRITDQKYVVELRVTDSTNLTSVRTVEIRPRLVSLTLKSNVAGISPGANGLWESLTSPVSVVAGVQNLFAPSPQFINGRVYQFASWSNGGTATQSVGVNSDSTFTANYTEVTDGSAGQFFADAGDAYVRDGDGGDTNYGQDAELQTKISGDLGKTRYAYFRFDVGTAGVTTAKLRLFGKLSGNGEIVPTNLYGVDANWTENTLTFNNRPLFNGNPIATNTAADQTGRWYEFDVSSYVKAARLAGATSVAFAAAQAMNSSPYFGISSGEAAAGQPQLYVGTGTVTPPPPPPPGGATIRGTVFLDADRDGAFDAGETGVAGRTIYLDNNNNSALDGSEPSTTTAADGTYAFTNLAAGTYKIRQLLPSGFAQSSPANNFGNNATVSGTQTASGEDFGTYETVTPPPPPTGGATIRGTVFLDVDRDGTRDAGETGVSGRTIYLDSNNNSVLDSGELSTATGADGTYSFTNLTAGTYKIRQSLPANFIQTTPTNNYGNNATVSGTQTAAGEDFGTAENGTNPTPSREITAAADSYVRDSNSRTNYGSGTELAVQSGVSGVNRRGYLKFDISSITNFSSVMLRLSGRLSESVTNGISVGVFDAGENWTETGLTWNNRPRENATPIGSVKVRDTTRRTYELDLTAYIQAQKAAGRQFVTLVLKNMTNTATAQTVFAAREFSGGGSRLAFN